MADQPWHELPPEIARVLRPMLTEIADEMIEAVRTVPAYARPLEGPFGEGIRAGVRGGACDHFLAEIEAGGPVPRSDVYIALGRGEMRAGRSLDSLLSAYRAGARVAWRRFAAAGVAGRARARRRCTCWPSRSSPTSTSSRPSPPRATRSSSRPSPARPSCGAAGWCACWSASRPSTPPRVEAPRREAGWPLPRKLAARRDRRRGPRGGGLAPARDAMPSRSAS